MPSKRPRLLFLILILFGRFPAAIWAAAPQISPKPERSDEDILRRGTSSSWSDVTNQDVHYNGSPLERDNLQNHDQWTQNPFSSDFWSWLFGNSNATSTPAQISAPNGSSTFWSDFWSATIVALQYGVWIVASVVLIAALAWLIKNQEVMMLLLRRNRNQNGFEDVAAQQAKYSDLPVELEKGLVGLKAQAALLRAQGDYSRAIIYLFSYLLVELDSAQCIALARGKTNYRYLRELSQQPLLESRLRRVISLFEETYFGGKPVQPAQFETVWEDLPAFESAIRNAQGLHQRRDGELASKGPLVGATS